MIHCLGSSLYKLSSSGIDHICLPYESDVPMRSMAFMRGLAFTAAASID